MLELIISRFFTTKINVGVVVLATILLQACSTYEERKTEYAGVKQRWEKDYKAKENNVSNIELVNFRTNSNTLLFSVQTDYIQKEYEFDRYNEYSRMHYGADVAMLVIPLFGWIACVMDVRHCFGYTGDWSDYPYEIDKNERLSGNVKEKSYSSFPSDVLIKSDLIGVLKSGETVTHSYDDNRHSLRYIPIKNIVQGWAAKPESLKAVFTILHNNKRYESEYQFSDADLLVFSFKSDAWNTPKENRHHYFYQLTAALQKGDHAAALRAYGKLEALAFKKPESFWYRYAVSAKQVGKIDLAKEKAEKYLQVSTKRRYQKEATALLSLL
ncbi:hypothetical protein IMCC21906_01089 [Spongiibacter sp. IMCC21906]|uniref:hypothetical protein n=1 Tax=Spongiibacter sp. IMCC21906 TaxID=1620392 RepID=UPI00062DE461|nr:hypothetical protein [Spongiibacter sp. IMCC21906]AKH68768.1 hypothetical protein IMCC21906_01089 [Spongiibacter sp. IMCC21906]